MPNHWHFVVWPERDGDLPAFMQQVTNTHVKPWKAKTRGQDNRRLAKFDLVRISLYNRRLPPEDQALGSAIWRNARLACLAGVRSPVIRQIACTEVDLTAAQSSVSCSNRTGRAGLAYSANAPSSSAAAPCKGASLLSRASMRTGITARVWAGSNLAIAAITLIRGCCDLSWASGKRAGMAYAAAAQGLPGRVQLGP